MTDNTIRDAAVNFEAVKVSMSQDKNGIILRLNIHPNDCPRDLHTDWVGSRYMVAMVKLTDEGMPDDRGASEEKKLITSAGMLCRNPDFYTFLTIAGLTKGGVVVDAAMEAECAHSMRTYCGVASRSDLAKDKAAMEKFEALRQSFMLWKEGKPWKMKT